MTVDLSAAPRSLATLGMTGRVVLRALAANKRGRLTLTLPDGDVMTFGDGTGDAAITIRDANFFRRCLLFGDIGFAESYMAGEWDTGDIAAVIAWFILNDKQRRIPNFLGFVNKVAHRLRSNTVANSRRNISAHYDLSNDLFALFLDPSMTYSSALFEREEMTLGDAQIAKYERLCSLLDLKPSDHLLEIGGGWGAFSRYAVKKYGCRITTITISQQQFEWALREKNDDRIDIQLLDYRKLDGQFDKIVSIEMLEAVGHRYFETFFAKCAEVLKPNGVMAVQVITCPEWRCEPMRNGVDFIQKHIFPGGEVPSIGCLQQAMRRSSDLSLINLFDFGASYARTLQLWAAAFESNLDRVRALGFDESFIRKWRYYFRYCEAGFTMRHISVAQMLLRRTR